MARKAPRKPTHYNKESNNRTKAQSSVPLKFVLEELERVGYEVIPAEGRVKKSQTKFALAWFKSAYPDAGYSKSGRTVEMGLVSEDGEHYDDVVSVPISEGQLSKDAVKKLRDKTGLDLDPQAAEDEKPEAHVPRVSESDEDGFDWEDDVVYVVPEKAAPRP